VQADFIDRANCRRRNAQSYKLLACVRPESLRLQVGQKTMLGFDVRVRHAVPDLNAFSGKLTFPRHDPYPQFEFALDALPRREKLFVVTTFVEVTVIAFAITSFARSIATESAGTRSAKVTETTSIGGSHFTCESTLGAVSHGVRKQRQVTSAFDSGRDLTLLLGRGTRDTARNDLAAIRDEALQSIRLLVIDSNCRIQRALTAHQEATFSFFHSLR